MLKRKLVIIFSTMFLFSLISYILVAAFGRRAAVYGEEEKIIVTSFYPVCLVTQNLTQGMENVRVVNLTENQTGCLHDYQMTTKDMLVLETADLLIINGGGMELFIMQAAERLTGITIIDSCEGMELLAGEAHDHEHVSHFEQQEEPKVENDKTQNQRNSKANENQPPEYSGENKTQNQRSSEANENQPTEYNGENGIQNQRSADTKGNQPPKYSEENETQNQRSSEANENQPPEYNGENGIQNQKSAESDEKQNLEFSDNGHVWMDMERYLLQIHTIADGLCRAYPQEEAHIRANESAYCEKIAALAEEYADLKKSLSGLPVVTFHDAFIYLCDSFGLEVVHGIDLDADSALSAGEIAEIADEIRLHGVRYLLAERETGGIAKQIAEESGCTVIYLDPLTSGSSEPDTYLAVMRKNLEQLREIQR